MDVFLANEQELPVDETTLTALARHTLGVEDLADDFELSILLVGSDHMQTLNARFAGNDYVTDVLAFPMMEEGEASTIMGDVVICPETARDNAARMNHSLDLEMRVLVVHGTLHLLGYDHQGPEDRARMDERMKEVLRTFEATAIQ